MADLLRAVALAAVTLVAVGLASPQGARAQDDAAEEYRLGTGDRLQIRTFGREDLSGAFEVRAPGTIAFPILGTLDVRQLTPTELEKRISERLVNDYRVSASVNVEITAYRPFYIVGDVMSPGKYPYVPGITVLQAVAIAGGYYTFRPSATAVQMDAIRAQEDFNIYTIQQRAALIRRARLVAEREGQPELAVPAELLSIQNVPDIQVVLAAERQLFTARRDGLKAELAQLEGQKASFQKEIAALKVAVSASAEQHRLLDLELQDAQKLLDKGLTQRPRVLELQRLVAGLTAEESQNRAFLARAEQNIGKVDEQATQRQSSFREEVEQQMSEIETRLEELAQHKAAAQDLVAATAHSASMQSGSDIPATRGKFVIRRPEAGAEKRLDADETTRVLPDDTIEVPPLVTEFSTDDAPAPATGTTN